MLIRKISAIILVLVFSLGSQAQESKVDKKFAKSLLSQAREAMYQGRFQDAQRSYSKLVEIDPNNATYYFEYGVSYLESNDEVDKAVKLLQLSKIKTKGQPEPSLLYYLGKAYQEDHRYDEAIDSYIEFKEITEGDKKQEELRAEVEARIKMCQHGKYQLEQHSVNPIANKDKYKDLNRYFINAREFVVLENVGPTINTPYSDYSPIPLNEESYLLYTSRQYLEGKNEDYYLDGEFYDNVFVSRYREGKWENGIEIDHSSFFNSILQNSPNHNSIVSRSYDGKKLLFYLDGQIQYTRYDSENSRWSDLQTIEIANLDKKTSIWSVAFSPTEDAIYFSAERKKEGYGGRDLYVALKVDDNKYGELQNLGATINTKKNEESPVLSPDGKKLYFSSQGHSSIGGYDIFSSSYVNGEWSTPVSLGVPINSSNDEIHYLPDASGEFAYYATNRNGGYGSFDIYKIYRGKLEFDERAKPTLDVASLNEGIKRKPMDEISFLSRAPMNPDEDLEEQFDEIQEKAIAEVTKKEQDSIAEEAPADTAMIADASTEIINEERSPNTTTQEEVSEDPKSEETTSKESIDKQASSTPIKENKEQIIKEESSTPVKETTSKEVSETELAQNTTKEPSGVKNSPDVPKNVEELVLDIPFGFNGSSLNEEAKKQLRNLNAYLKANPNTIVTITGHADSVGSEEVNLAVSKQRALMALEFLVSEGADVYRVNYDYKGESEPLVANSTSENRSKNRRIELELESNKLFSFVQFGFNSSSLSSTSESKLNEVAQFLKANKTYVADLRGYTDSSGDPAYNKYLSEKRAKAVASYLTENGVESNQISISYFGSEDPTIPNNTAANRQINRRVEIRVN